ncbi:phosphatidylinositol N-acetylglucosaminyltransferase [Hysterangium stoloniferum]|nr:phosphatidylinositol N-acetylglucosaminyltransferase [Hysterangium stoloniferum]
MSESEPWQRVLWKRQAYPDNHVPSSFLSDLRRNTNFEPYTYIPVVLASCMVTQHISTIFIFLAVFARLQSGVLDPRLLVAVAVCCHLGGHIVWEVAESNARENRGESRAKAIKSSILVFFALLALSPVLRTLTAATSSDSIWALSACLFILNALLADYGSSRELGQHRERLTFVLSMNAAISASVVLASRLSTNIAVFALTLFSVQSFALFPILRVRLQFTPPVVQVILTIILSTLSLYLTVLLSMTVGCLLAFTLTLVTFIAPGILVWAQKYKNEIRGPWDVAVPQVR